MVLGSRTRTRRRVAGSVLGVIVSVFAAFYFAMTDVTGHAAAAAPAAAVLVHAGPEGPPWG